MRYFTLGSLLAMVALSFSLAQPAQAYIFGFSDKTTQNVLTLNGNVKLSFDDSGWYRNAGDPIHFSGYQNYIVAQPGDVDTTSAYRNYFVFDISALSASVTSASLTLNSYDVTSIETYTLFDVTTEIHTLIDGTNPSFPPHVFTLDAFNDLGDGDVYGVYAYTTADHRVVRTLTLNDAFLSDLNTAIGATAERFAIGGAVDTSRPVDVSVVVPPATVPEPAGSVPEPSTLLLLGLALVGLAAWRRKHAA